MRNVITRGPGSVVGIATGYGLDGPGIETPGGGEIFRTFPDRPWGPPSLLYNGYRSPAEIVGSNPTGGMDICLLSVSCVVR